MPKEFFLTLPKEEQTEIITNVAQKLGMEPYVIEKDLWVCWTLQELFSMPNSLKMAFKGGTSLSKAFNAIYRFSEDIDITIDYINFENNLQNPFAEGVSKNAKKILSDSLRKQLNTYVHEVITPYFIKISQRQFSNEVTIATSPTGEELRIQYSSVIPHNAYVKSEVLLEFGARNVTEPSEFHLIEPYITQFIDNDQLILPKFTVPVLSPQRTFWEKATLIHVECSRAKQHVSFALLNGQPFELLSGEPFALLKSNAERLSRHWYDLTMLSRQTIGQSALKNIDLLKEVIKHKKVFFDGKNYNYDACLNGGFLLLPEDNNIQALEQDYKKMIDSGMFFKEPPSFKDILEELRVVEFEINKNIKILAYD